MSLYSMWLAFKQRQTIFWVAAAGITLFIAGWQTGRVMSPYYAAHPIVFQESNGSQAAALPDTSAQLAALQVESKQLATGTAQPTPQVAAAQADQPAPIANTGAPQGVFVASVNSDLYHHESCSAVKQIKEENKVAFATAEDAEKAGYVPSKCTQELLKQ